MIARLAALDSASKPAVPVLLGLVDAEAVAAFSLADGTIVADPFRRTADVIDLLRARARQLEFRGPMRRGRVVHRLVDRKPGEPRAAASRVAAR